MRRMILAAALALTALAGAKLGLFSPRTADAACPIYCCPGTNICQTCCTPRLCEMNCP